MKYGYTYRGDESPLKFHTYLRAALPPPPPSVVNSNAISGPLQMFGNDQVGDCTAADFANGLMLQTALGSGMVVATTAQVLAFYSGYTGYVATNPASDTGASLTQAATYGKSTGLLGHRLHAFLDVDRTNITLVKQAIYLFKGCSIGLNLPSNAEFAFQLHREWDDTLDKTIIGGHDVLLVDYDDIGPSCLTWGRLQKMTWEWFSTYVVETQVRLYEDAVGWAASYNLNMPQLEADLAQL